MVKIGHFWGFDPSRTKNKPFWFILGGPWIWSDPRFGPNPRGFGHFLRILAWGGSDPEGPNLDPRR